MSSVLFIPSLMYSQKLQLGKIAKRGNSYVETVRIAAGIDERHFLQCIVPCRRDIK